MSWFNGPTHQQLIPTSSINKGLKIKREKSPQPKETKKKREGKETSIQNKGYL